MPSKEILRIRICIHISVISYFQLQIVSKSFSQNILGLKVIKLDCIIIYLDLNTIGKPKKELDGACGLPLVNSIFELKSIDKLTIFGNGKKYFRPNKQHKFITYKVLFQNSV